MKSVEYEAVKNAASQVLGVTPEEIRPASRFVEDLGADSLELLEIAIRLSEEFRVPVRIEELKEIPTVREAAEYLRQKEIET